MATQGADPLSAAVSSKHTDCVCLCWGPVQGSHPVPQRHTATPELSLHLGPRPCSAHLLLGVTGLCIAHFTND